jgi:hypothetical protein
MSEANITNSLGDSVEYESWIGVPGGIDVPVIVVRVQNPIHRLANAVVVNRCEYDWTVA